MDKNEYHSFQVFLMNIIRDTTPHFRHLDNMDINIALYYTLYHIYIKNKDNVDAINDLCFTFFGKHIDDINKEFLAAHPKVQTKDLMMRYMMLNSMGPSRNIYFNFTDNKCNGDDKDEDCIKLIPVDQYKRLVEAGIKPSLDMFQLDHNELYLFIDVEKIKTEYGFDFNEFGSGHLFMIECAETPYFKELCDKKVLYKGSERPKSKGFFVESYRCLCWPEESIEDYIEQHKNTMNGGYKKKQIVEYWIQHGGDEDTENFIQGLKNLEKKTR